MIEKIRAICKENNISEEIMLQIIKIIQDHDKGVLLKAEFSIHDIKGLTKSCHLCKEVNSVLNEYCWNCSSQLT